MAPRSTFRRLLARIKPSYLVLLALVPFVIYLFSTDESYQAALVFILPGLRFTLLVALFGYLVASVLGLLFAGMLLLRTGPRTLRNFLLLATAFLVVGALFFARPRATYVLVGEPEGRVAILRGTPQHLRVAIEEGSFAEGATEREFRSVPDAAAARERLESGVVTAAFLPEAEAPAGADELWRATFLPDAARNPAIFSVALALLLGLLTLGAWQSEEHPLAIFAELYIDLVRGIPMLVVIIFIGFVLPGALREISGGAIQINSDLLRGVLAIAIGYAAYMAEIFRAGIEAIPRGQVEAARSLGLTGWQTARFVVLPQAIRIVLPPLGNEFIAMLKDTALLSVIGVADVTRKAREFGASTLDLFPPYNTAAVIYVALTLSASSLLRWLERRSATESSR